jgi:hypothetical protein
MALMYVNLISRKSLFQSFLSENLFFIDFQKPLTESKLNILELIKT